MNIIFDITLYDITIITTILVGTFSGLIPYIPYILYMFIFLIIGPYTTFISLILYCLFLYYNVLK